MCSTTAVVDRQEPVPFAPEHEGPLPQPAQLVIGEDLALAARSCKTRERATECGRARVRAGRQIIEQRRFFRTRKRARVCDEQVAEEPLGAEA